MQIKTVDLIGEHTYKKDVNKNLLLIQHEARRCKIAHIESSRCSYARILAARIIYDICHLQASL